MRLRRTAWALAVVLLALPAPADVAAGEPDPLLLRLQAKIDRLKSLKGRFSQTLDSRGLGRRRAEEGRFWIRKPSLMRWEYESPERKLAVLDGRNTWLYLPADREVYQGTVKDLEEAGAATLLLAGRVSLVHDFRSRRLSPEEAGPQGFAGAVAIELRALKPAEEFDRLVVAVDPERLLMRRITVFDALGGRLILDLYDLDEDPLLADDLFRFEVPPGVEIVKEH